MQLRLGKSVEGRVIRGVFRRGRSARTVVIFGGFHGDEPKSVRIAEMYARWLGEKTDRAAGVSWLIVPIVNPDGFERRRRRNARRVDLNRNFPTENWAVGNRRSRMFGGEKPGSEPETRAVIRVIERYEPAAIVTIHSIGRARHCNNFDGPGADLARAMSGHNRYPVADSIGYPTPGSFGTWAGIERRIPTITLELPSLHSVKRCWQDNRSALAAAEDFVTVPSS